MEHSNSWWWPTWWPTNYTDKVWCLKRWCVKEQLSWKLFRWWARARRVSEATSASRTRVRRPLTTFTLFLGLSPPSLSHHDHRHHRDTTTTSTLLVGGWTRLSLPLLESLLPWKNRMSWEKEAFCSVFECCDAFFWERKRGAQRAPWITWTDARDRPSSSSATTVNVKFYTISNFIWFDLWSSLWAIDDGHPVMRSYCEVRAKNDITC